MADLTEYYRYREYMDTGDLLLWRGPNPISAAIRWRTGCDVNHASGVITFSEYSGCPQPSEAPASEFRVYQGAAISRGFFVIPLSNALAEYGGEVYWCPLKSKFRQYRCAFGSQILALSGHRYDFIGLVKNLFHRVRLSMARVYCSESYQGIGYAVGLPKLKGFENTGLWPGELEKLGWTEPRVRII